MHVGLERKSTGGARCWRRSHRDRRSRPRPHCLLRRRQPRADRARSGPADGRASFRAPNGRRHADTRPRPPHDERAGARRARAPAPDASRARRPSPATSAKRKPHARTWNDQRDIWLVAKALGVDASKPALRSALSRPDGLSALVVQQAFGLAVRQALSPSKLRAALALVALERAFGDNVKEGLGKGSALSAKAGRVLAGQLLQKPRELPTDTRLIAALCAPIKPASSASTSTRCALPCCAG